MTTRENATEDSEKATQNTIKKSFQNDCQQIYVPKKAHMLVSPILPKYPVDLVVAVIFLWNAKHKVLNWCENVGEEYQKKTFIR